MHSFFDTALFLVCVYFMGFVAAIPIGASQFEIARRSLNGFLVSALCVVAGSVSSDLIYGSIALFGLGMFLQQPEVEGIFWLVNAALTFILGIGALREGRRKVPKVVATVEESEPPADIPLDKASATASASSAMLPTMPSHDPSKAAMLAKLRKTKLAYLTGFSLAFTNPMMIAWWLLAARLLKDFHIAPADSFGTRLLFLGAGGLGIASYLTFFAFMVFRAHKSLSRKRSTKLNFWFGISMIALAIYFVVRAIQVLLPHSSLPSLP